MINKANANRTLGFDTGQRVTTITGNATEPDRSATI
jgi:hypothetical protein